MESFFEKLANSNLGGSSSEHLKLLGKRAAGAYVRKEADSLNAAVAGVLDGEDLNRDQVRRVSEMANQATWRTSFHEGGQAATFDPADADIVLGEMSARPDVVQSDASSMDYLNDVPNQTRDVDWADAFGIKVDSPEYEALNPTGPEQATAEKTAAALDLARFGVDQLVGELVGAGEDFYQMVKQAHLRDGHGILQIAQAIGQAVEDSAFGTSLMDQSAARLQREGVKIDEADELRKLAHPLVINTEHPLLLKAAILEKLAFSHYSARAKHEDLRGIHRHAHKVLRDKLREA